MFGWWSGSFWWHLFISLIWCIPMQCHVKKEILFTYSKVSELKSKEQFFGACLFRLTFSPFPLYFRSKNSQQSIVTFTQSHGVQWKKHVPQMSQRCEIRIFMDHSVCSFHTRCGEIGVCSGSDCFLKDSTTISVKLKDVWKETLDDAVMLLGNPMWLDTMGTTYFSECQPNRVNINFH